jgi:hypothetical protein
MGKRDSDILRQKALREREDEKEAELKRKMSQLSLDKKQTPSKYELTNLDPTQEIHDAEVLVEQVNQLYQLFFSGVERLPPTPKRERLEALITRLNTAPKLTPAIRFRVQNLQQRFQVYRDKWERSLKNR